MDGYAPSWMAGARTRTGLTIPCWGCARRGGPRDVPPPRRPRASEPRVTRRRRLNAPAAPRRSSLEPPPRPLCGLLRPSRGGPRRGTGTHRRNSRAYGRAALVREPPVPSPGVSENPGAPRARFWGRNVATLPPFLRSYIRTDAPARVRVHGGGFSFGCKFATGRIFWGLP